jgi:hypothetical protein
MLRPMGFADFGVSSDTQVRNSPLLLGDRAGASR